MPISRRLRVILAAVVLHLTCVYPSRTVRSEPPEPQASKRIPWTASRIKGTPEPPLPYVTERAFPELKFKDCLDLVPAPGTNRLFVVEQAGRIYSFPNVDKVKSADLAADLAKGIPGVQQTYALAFHPDFPKNQYCYICYIKEPDLEDGTHVARFRVRETEPPTIDLSSETTILTWFSGGHNGACLKFGPDGYLYISTGDAGPANPPDPRKAGQDLSNLLSAILRVDVDRPEAGKSYRIPPDNPFVNMKGARGEIWAYGLRNPWRMSFDRETGDLWVGDVGWERWEMLNRVERGGNYGWAVMEGRQSTHPEWPRGPTPILPPTIDHPHSESSSITDGLTYYGRRLKELRGAHIYGDYDTGKFWSFRYEKGKVVDHREIADTTHRVVGFGEGRDGEFYILDHTAGTIHRLVPNPEAGRPVAFPKTLRATGLFSDVPSQTPMPGVLAYAINAPAWEDRAVSERFVAVPGGASIKAEGASWSFPKDSVLVKSLSLDAGKGSPSGRRRVETRLLHFDGLDWRPYSYRWNDEQTDAVLVGPAGEESEIETSDAAAPGGSRKQTWRFSGRAECQRCHNKWAGPPLAFDSAQLSRSVDQGGVAAPQLETFARLGLIDRVIPKGNGSRLARPNDSTATLDERARSYLQTNCSHCHRMHAGSAVLSKMTLDLALEKTDMVGVRPTQGTFAIHDARVIAPGDPYRSILPYRMAKLGGGRMPHIGSAEVDIEGVNLMFDWISAMPKGSTTGGAASRESPADLVDLGRLRGEPNSENRAKLVDRLLSTTRGAFMLSRSVDSKSLPKEAASLAIDRGARSGEASVRDLFERFLATDQRVKRLGNTIDTARLLSLAGDSNRGKQVFFNTEGVSCKNCHRVGQVGTEIGPDLSTIGKKLDRSQLLESVLEPSKLIDPKYVTHLVETKDGRVLSGLVADRDEQAVTIRDAQNQVHRLRLSEIEQLVPRQQSLMPDLLLRDMTAQQVADLLSYLGSLK